MQAGIALDGTSRKAIAARIAAIDRLVTEQVNEVLHDAKFQRLEASWRSLHKLVTKNELSTSMRVRVFNAKRSRDREGLRPRPGIRPVADVQAHLRARVRHPRRRPLQLHHRRHGVRALAARHQLPQGGLGGGRRRPRAVHRQRQPRHVRPGLLHRPGPSDRHRQDLRHERDGAVEQPAQPRGLSLSRAHRPRVLQRLPWGGPNGAAVEGFDFHRGRRRGRPLEVPVGRRVMGPGGTGHEVVRHLRMAMRDPGHQHRRQDRRLFRCLPSNRSRGRG